MIFADALTSDQVLLAMIALMGTGLAGFLKLINNQNKAHDRNTKQLGRIASATERGNREALAQGATETIVAAVQNIKEQKVEHLHAEHAVIDKVDQ